MSDAYAQQMQSINPEAEQPPDEAVQRLLAKRGQAPRVTEHLFRSGTAGHEAQCGVSVPDVEDGRIVGTTCGYLEHEHVRVER